MKRLFLPLLLLTGNAFSVKAQTSPIIHTKKTPMATSISLSPLASGLLLIGKEGIEPGNNKALDAYFAPGYVLHSQSGDLNLEQLKAYWAALRRALTCFTVTREQIIVEGRMAAARSTFSGTFDKEFTPAGGAAIKPTGQPVRFEVIGTFQFNEAGQLVEEWVQSDQVSFFKQFGVDRLSSKK